MDDANPSLVTIVMATFNRSKQLESTISNIFQQSYKRIELLIVNDGSSDDTCDTLIGLQQNYGFTIINNKKNLGLQKSLNLGIRQAKGRYIARIDDHDKWIDYDKLSKQVAFMEANSAVGLVGTGFEVGGKKINNPLTDTKIRHQILMRSPFCHVSVLMEKAIFEKVGGYDEELTYSEDWDLWLKMGKHTEMANLPDISVSIEEESGSLSDDYFLRQLPINRQMLKQHYRDYPKSIKAFLYHQFLRIFFGVFSVGGKMHTMMKKTFLDYFDLSDKKSN